MIPSFKIEHEFVEFIPKERRERVVYISISCATSVHSCFCGCGTKVVTPIGPARWHLLFDGETVSLNHSIGNWAYPCRSHYFIRQNVVVWADGMSEERIAWGRSRDRAALEAYFDERRGGSVAIDSGIRAKAAKKRRKRLVDAMSS